MMAVGGGLALATGVTLVVLDVVRRRKQRMAVLPTAAWRLVGVSAGRRF